MATGYDGAEISQADIDGWSSWLLPAEVLKDSPSRSDGVSEDLERTYRRKTIIFMEEIGELVKVDWQSQVTAQLFFHYYFARHSFKRHVRFNVAVAALFLAAKVEECPSMEARVLEKLLVKAHKLWNRRVGEKSDMLG